MAIEFHESPSDTPDEGEATLGGTTDAEFRSMGESMGIPEDDLERALAQVKIIRARVIDAATKYVKTQFEPEDEDATYAFRQALHEITELPHGTLENLLASLIHVYALALQKGII